MDSLISYSSFEACFTLSADVRSQNNRYCCLDNPNEVNPLNAELNPIYHLLALLGAHHILHVSRIRVKFYCVTLNSESGVQWVRAKKNLAPVYFKEANFDRHCKLIATSVLRKLTGRKVMQVNPLPLPGLKNNLQRATVKISGNGLPFVSGNIFRNARPV